MAKIAPVFGIGHNYAAAVGAVFGYHVLQYAFGLKLDGLVHG